MDELHLTYLFICCFHLGLQWTSRHKYLLQFLLKISVGMLLEAEFLDDLVVLRLDLVSALIIFCVFNNSSSNGHDQISLCLSLTNGDVEHFVMCSLAICIYSLKKCLFSYFSFLIKLLNYILLDIWFENISFHSNTCPLQYAELSSMLRD